MKDTDGYSYVGLLRCESSDHFLVPQYNLNQFAGESPDMDMSATCGKCAGRHKTKNCYRNFLDKCVKCVQNRARNLKHSALSH